MNKFTSYISFAFIAIMSFMLASCNEDIDIETETSISYTLTISPDLLKFVTPQVSYIDEKGVLTTITGVEDLDGKVIENGTEIGSDDSYTGAWTSTVITGTGYKCWTVKMKFKHLGFHSHMSVKYLRNDFVEDTSGKVYDFHHDINTDVIATKTIKTTNGWFGGESIDQSTYVDSHVSITVGDYHYGDNIETYLMDLMNNPDKVGYYVDENGDLMRKDEF